MDKPQDGANRMVPPPIPKSPRRSIPRGPAPFASFEDLSDGTPETSPDQESVKAVDHRSEATSESTSGSPWFSNNHVSVPPRINVFSASSSSQPDSDGGSSPERTLFAGISLKAGFEEEASDLRSSAEDLYACGLDIKRYPRSRSTSMGRDGRLSPRSELDLERWQERERRASQSSIWSENVIVHSGRSSRLSSFGSLEVRTPSPYRTLQETSFCGSRPISPEPELIYKKSKLRDALSNPIQDLRRECEALLSPKRRSADPCLSLPTATTPTDTTNDQLQTDIEQLQHDDHDTNQIIINRRDSPPKIEYFTPAIEIDLHAPDDDFKFSRRRPPSSYYDKLEPRSYKPQERSLSSTLPATTAVRRKPKHISISKMLRSAIGGRKKKPSTPSAAAAASQHQSETLKSASSRTDYKSKTQSLPLRKRTEPEPVEEKVAEKPTSSSPSPQILAGKKEVKLETERHDLKRSTLPRTSEQKQQQQTEETVNKSPSPPTSPLSQKAESPIPTSDSKLAHDAIVVEVNATPAPSSPLPRVDEQKFQVQTTTIDSEGRKEEDDEEEEEEEERGEEEEVRSDRSSPPPPISVIEKAPVVPVREKMAKMTLSPIQRPRAKAKQNLNALDEFVSSARLTQAPSNQPIIEIKLAPSDSLKKKKKKRKRKQEEEEATAKGRVTATCTATDTAKATTDSKSWAAFNDQEMFGALASARVSASTSDSNQPAQLSWVNADELPEQRKIASKLVSGSCKCSCHRPLLHSDSDEEDAACSCSCTHHVMGHDSWDS